MASLFNVGDVIRLPNYTTCGGYRCWKIVGIHLGAVKQESTYELIPIDVDANQEIQVPCIILDMNLKISKV